MENDELGPKAQMIHKRNWLYVRFFEHHLPDRNIRFTGNAHAPVIVIDNKWMSNSYIKNFTIHFMDDRDKGKVLHTYKLSSQHPERLDDEERFRPWFEKYPMERCYTVKLENSEMYVSGMKYGDGPNGNGKVKWPLFSSVQPAIFFSKDFAEKVVDEYESNGTLAKGQKLVIEWTT